VIPLLTVRNRYLENFKVNNGTRFKWKRKVRQSTGKEKKGIYRELKPG